MANFGDDSVSVIGEGMVDTVPVGAGPGHLAVNSDGSRVIVSNLNDNTVWVIAT